MSLLPRSHEELDKEVEESVPQDAELDSYARGTLLQAIVLCSDELLNPQYAKFKLALDLVNANTTLQEELDKAWKEKSYRRIRDLDILKPLKPPMKRTPAFGLDSDDIQAIKAAWEVTYSGQIAKLLLHNINAMDRTEPHTNYVTIVQSSGTGKSRMVDELAKEVFTLPFNLRMDDAVFAFPAPDHQIRTFFIESPKSVKHSKQSKESIALAWRDYLSTTLSAFYDGVVRKCNRGGNESATNPDIESPAETHDLVKQSLESLLTVLDSHSLSPADPRTVKVILYFDEAHVLSQLVGDHQTLLDVLCSVLSDFSELSLFSIFLSTHCALSLHAPPGRQASSERVRTNSDKLQAPITEIPFDCCPRLVIKPGNLRLKDLSTIEFLARWGRPLWWSMQVAKESRDARSSLIDFARTKLLCRQDISVDHDKVSPTALTAVIDVMLMLDYEPRHESSHKAQVDMVTSHMRVAYSVPKHRTSFRSGYPSEPLLAEAAMQQAHGFQTRADKAAKFLDAPLVNVMLKTLNNNLSSGMLDRGQRGELIMRCLLVQAYMRAIVEEGHACFSHGCKLVTFIRQLFADKYATEILDSRPDNAKGETFKEQFKDSVVRFTHFVKAVDNTAPSTRAVFAAFVRGMAFICHDQQNAVDLVIPVLLNQDAPLEESVMSAILIQVKRRTKAGGADTFAFKQEDVGLFYFVDDDDDGRPYITIVAELGVMPNRTPSAEIKTVVLSLPKQPPPGQQQSEANPSAPNPASPPSSSTDTSLPPQTPSKLRVPPQPESIHHEAVHPRYSLTVYGCSDTVYRVIHPGERYIYRQLLATSHFLGEHGRLDADSLSAVRRMEPFWNIGDECYHWIEDPVLQSRPIDGDMDGHLLVGRYDDALE